MNYMLAHTIIWFAENAPRLTRSAANMIPYVGNTTCVSVVSVWEVAIECSIEKLRAIDISNTGTRQGGLTQMNAMPMIKSIEGLR